MRIALAQINPIVGDLAGNAALIESAARRAASEGADLLVCSELVICGYPPKDLLLRSGFVAACDKSVNDLAQRLPPELGVLVGHPTHRGITTGRFANGASLLFGGRVESTIHKTLLPNYDVFDERRYFRTAESVRPIEFKNLRLGVHICEDAWWGVASTSYHDEPVRQFDPVAELAKQGVDLFINLSASPFEVAKPDRRTTLVERHVHAHQRPFLFVNQVGGNDDLVFDGHSFVTDARGRVVDRLAGFEPDFRIIDTDQLPARHLLFETPREALLLNALVLGLKDYVTKSGFTDCVLGLSGGIDSALAAYIASRAVGPESVHGLLMPSRYSSDHSVADAKALAVALGMDWKIIPIDSIHKSYEALPVIAEDLAGEAASLADQNLQARIRGAIVMTRSNRYGWLALATGNKSELAVGYCTLYGDMCGGFAVLCDLLKRDVYAVSKYINDVVEKREVIPVSTLTKVPSAELAPNQTDQDTLPPYPVLDGILEGLVEREMSVREVAQTYPLETVQWVARRLDRNEFKRRQMPPGIKLSQRAFGSGRRMPMAARIGVE
ncbi:MAG TPA: NAD+ synthase [Caulifigura sp.]|nr:NAD+ synthase [Caulifigura sp.]